MDGYSKMCNHQSNRVYNLIIRYKQCNEMIVNKIIMGMVSLCISKCF